MPGLEYWRIFPKPTESAPLHDGVTYRAIAGLNGWLLYVNVASLDETVGLVQKLATEKELSEGGTKWHSSAPTKGWTDGN